MRKALIITYGLQIKYSNIDDIICSQWTYGSIVLKIVLFSDGGARPNPGPSGAGFYAETEDGVAYLWWRSMPGLGETNNRGELLAGLKAFEKSKELGVTDLTLRPDSAYVINAIKKINVYEENNYIVNQEPMKNVDLLKDLHAAVSSFVGTKAKFNVEWVKGHSGVYGNEVADRMATRAVIAAQKGKQVEEFITTTIKKVANPKSANYDRLFGNSHLYFNTLGLQTESGRYIYFTGHHGKDDSDALEKGKIDTSFGKSLPEAVWCLIYAKEQNKLIDTVIREQLTITPNTRNVPYIMNLGQIVTPKSHEEIVDFDGLYLSLCTKAKRLGETILIDTYGNRISRTPPSPKLGQLTMNKLEGEALRFEDYLNGKSKEFTVTDITDKIFEEKEIVLKKKTKTEVVLNEGVIQKGVLVVDAPYRDSTGKSLSTQVRLTVGHDLYSTNCLRSLRKEPIKVKLLTWTVGHLTLGYALHFETPTGDAIRFPVSSNTVLIAPSKRMLKAKSKKK